MELLSVGDIVHGGVLAVGARGCWWASIPRITRTPAHASIAYYATRPALTLSLVHFVALQVSKAHGKANEVRSSQKEVGR